MIPWWWFIAQIQQGLRGNPRLCSLFFHPNCRGPAGVLGGASDRSHPQGASAASHNAVLQDVFSRLWDVSTSNVEVVKQRMVWLQKQIQMVICHASFDLMILYYISILYIIIIYKYILYLAGPYMDRDIFYWEWESLSLIHCPYTVDRSSYSCASWLFQGKPSTQVRAALKVGDTFGNLGGYPRFNETHCIPLCHGCFKAAFSFIWTYWPQSMLKTRAFLALTKWDISLVALKTDASCSYQQSPNKSHVATLGHHDFLLKGFPINPFGISVMIHHPDIRGWAVR